MRNCIVLGAHMSLILMSNQIIVKFYSNEKNTRASKNHKVL